MKRLSYTLLTIGLLVGAGFLRHAPATAADEQAAAAQAQQEESEFIPTEKLPADAIISFPVDI
jgi:hypothetical protein